MRCPHCGHRESKVTDSRAVEEGVRRRRECLRCGLRFTTYERVQTTALVVAKRDGRREEFRRDKLMAGAVKACTKRPVSFKEIEHLVDDIEGELQNLGHAEIPSSRLGEMVMERLKRLDRVAYIRFASVYSDFDDIERFEQAVKDLRGEVPIEEEAVEEPAPQTGQLSFLPPSERRRRPGRRGRRSPTARTDGEVKG